MVKLERINSDTGKYEFVQNFDSVAEAEMFADRVTNYTTEWHASYVSKETELHGISRDKMTHYKITRVKS